MLSHKNYIDIQAFQTKYAEGFHVGDMIQITEKVDGSNCSIQYNVDTGKLEGFSRKRVLNEELTLDGAYGFIQTLNPEPFAKYAKYRIFGEWNLKHIIKYPTEKIKQFWAFDVYDTVEEKWMPQEFSMQMAKNCGLNYVPVFYTGPFVSWKHIEGFIGKSEMGAVEGEGVVIKNQTTLNNLDSCTPFIVKLVCPQFKERMNRPAKKSLDADELAKREYQQNLVASVVTPARVEKNLYKLITEDCLIPHDWDSSHMNIIAKNLPRAVYNDCMKEANDIVTEVENFGRVCNSIVMSEVKKILAKQ